MSYFAVLGDIHHQLAMAVEGLESIEQELGEPLAQVFTVGDLGLFLEESDWDFLTGPKKYREPEISPYLNKCWAKWRWPMAMIAGNHEPFHKLRDWQPGTFGPHLTYTNAGWLEHRIGGLRVAGLSGIFHPDHLHFTAAGDRNIRSAPHPQTWPELMELVRRNAVATKRLTYFKEAEVEQVKSLEPTPHLLLLHDWPVLPGSAHAVHERRPEKEVVEKLQPQFVCCGHHHQPGDFTLGASRVLGLNLIHHSNDYAHRISPGWAAIFRWAGESAELIKVWP
jgi:hypothetical protein